MSVWLPLSALTAALLTAWPMLRQGTLIALAASGIAPRRVFSSLIWLALGIGVLGFALRDQVIPRLDPEVKLARARMLGRLAANEVKERSVGWQAGDHFWCSHKARPENGDLRMVAVFGADGSLSERTTVIADRLYWKDGHWRFVNAQVIGDRTAPFKRFTDCTVEETGLSLLGDPDALAARLKTSRQKTSDELLVEDPDNAWGQINVRLCYALLPMLCLLFALPGFIRLEGRNHMGAMVVKALMMSLVPLGAYWLLTRMLISHGNLAMTASMAVLGVLLGAGILRWWRMRL